MTVNAKATRMELISGIQVLAIIRPKAITYQTKSLISLVVILSKPASWPSTLA